MKIKLSTLLLSYCLMALPLSVDAISNSFNKESKLVSDYFIYYGISAMITEEMAKFTEEYDVDFRNAGCMVIDKAGTETHNQDVAKALSEALGHDDWMDELPIKIMGLD